jgi:hypothetical protein
MVGCCFFEAKNTIAAAEAAVEQAKAKGTITNAPYETCSAVAYLGGAKEVYGDCDWCMLLNGRIKPRAWPTQRWPLPRGRFRLVCP